MINVREVVLSIDLIIDASLRDGGYDQRLGILCPSDLADNSGRSDASALTEAQIIQFVCETVASLVLCTPAEVQESSSFANIGMDSLGMVEMTNRLSRKFNISLSQTAAFSHPSPKRLANKILSIPPNLLWLVDLSIPILWSIYWTLLCFNKFLFYTFV
jgi:acyl carrier protein